MFHGRAQSGSSLFSFPRRVRFPSSDIVVGNIAIEIKGPTTNQGLQSIADKIARYRLHFAGIVCVLFDVQDEAHYREWLRGIRDPDVVVIRID